MENLVSTRARENERFLQIADMLRFVDESRVKIPDLQVLAERKNFLTNNYPEGVEKRLKVDEFVVRMLGGADTELSTFEIANLIYDGSLHKIDKDLIQRELWSLQDEKIIIQLPNRRFTLSPKIKAEFL